MERVQRSNKFKLILGVVALTSLSLLAIGSMSWVLHAAEENSAKSERAEGEKAAEKKEMGGEEICCKPGDTTPPLELVKKIPPGDCIAPIRTGPSSPKKRSW